MFIVANTINIMGVASQCCADIPGCYARGKEYGLNKRLEAISLNIVNGNTKRYRLNI
jgi:hypothetical protein